MMNHVQRTNEKNHLISIDTALAFVIVQCPFRVKFANLKIEVNLI